MTPDHQSQNGEPGLCWWRALVAGLAHSVLLILAFPPVSLWGFALVAPAPLVLAGLNAGRCPKRVALFVTLGVLPFWAIEQRWAFQSSAAGFVPMMLLLAWYSGLFVWVLARLRRVHPRVPLWIVVPIAWTGAEVFRGSVLWYGFPWYLSAHPLIDAPFLPDAAGVVGAYGVGLLVAGLVGAGFDLAGRRRLSGLFGVGAVAGAWIGAALIGTRGIEQEEPVRIGVVQTNIPQSTKGGWGALGRLRALDTLIGLSLDAKEQGAELIVWPETMFPGFAIEAEWARELDGAGVVLFTDEPAEQALDAIASMTHLGEFPLGERALDDGTSVVMVPVAAITDCVMEFGRGLGVPLLVGATGYDRYEISSRDDGSLAFDTEGYNSVFRLDTNGLSDERYDKMYLTPFGEVMPYISEWSWLERVLLRVGVGAGGMTFNLNRGDERVVLNAAGVSVATPICYEATVPVACRKLVYERGERRAGLIVQLTNDGWFYGIDAGREQHLMFARWRAVELGTPIVRAANTGYSCLVDAAGAVVERAPARRESVLMVDATPSRGRTVYAVVGDAAGWGAFGLCGAMLGVSLFLGRGAGSRGQE